MLWAGGAATAHVGYLAVSTVLDSLDELRAGEKVEACCPLCEAGQTWWVPGYRLRLNRMGANRDNLGLECYRPGCGFVVNLNPGPPVILCAVCGQPLHRSVHDDTVFTCQGCGRRVTA